MTQLEQPLASPTALVSGRTATTSSSLFRPWAASESASEAAESLVQCSPTVGICAGLSRTGRPAKPRSAPSQPILTRLEGLVANLDESSQGSRSSSSSSSSVSSRSSSTSSKTSSSSSHGSCTSAPRDMRTKGKNSTARGDGSASSAPSRKAAGSAFSAPRQSTPPSGSAPRDPLAGTLMSLSPEEVALLAAQQQAFHEEALLAMAGLLPSCGPLPAPGGPLPAVPAAYLDEYARLLQQEQKAQGVAARKQRPKKYRCPHCQVAFSNNGQLRGHVRIHTGERPFKCEAESCGKRFTRNEELTRHKRIHSGQRPFACPACGKRFGRKDHLKKHSRTHDPAHRMGHLLPMLPPPHYLYGF